MAQGTFPAAVDIPAHVVSAIGSKDDEQISVFTQHLFASADETSLAAYSVPDLADYARALFSRFSLGTKAWPTPVIRRDGLSGGACLEILNENMPFLVDSVLAEIQARDLVVRMVLHPIFDVVRAPDGQLMNVAPRTRGNSGDQRRDSLIVVHLDSLEPEDEEDLIATLAAILGEVQVVVSDWTAMLGRLREALAAAQRSPPPVPADAMNEHNALIAWLIDDHFTFLGMRDYELVGDAKTGDLRPMPETGLGLLRDPELAVLRRGTQMVHMTAETRRLFFRPVPLIVTKANVVSRVHRRVHMDYIGIKLYRPDGTPSGELRIIGLFTSQAYNQSVRTVPFLRHKVNAVLQAAGHPPDSHAGKSLLNVLESFPRDELLQIGTRQLRNWTAGILDLELRPRTRVFVRVDRFDRFVSVLVFIRRDRYGTEVRERIGQLLSDSYDGRITAFYPFFMEGPMVRTQFIVARYEGPTPIVDERDLEHRVDRLVETWNDRLIRAISSQAALADQRRLSAKYVDAFPAGYAETFDEARALEDIERIEKLGPQRHVAIDFYREVDAPPHRVRVAIYRFDGPISLSQRVPILENLGFSVIDERSYHVTPLFEDGRRIVNLHDMVLETRDGSGIDLAKHELRLEDGFLAVFEGVAEDDAYNGLIVAATADWREAAAFRALGAYMHQLGAPYGRRYLADTLARHHSITANLMALFAARFDPDVQLTLEERQHRQCALGERIENELADVHSLEEDRILRQMLSLVLAAERTNFYALDASGRPTVTIAFKFASRRIDTMPLPKPLTEMWVFGPEVEGVHLRFAPIARGGIRWSDRAVDFRTEVLGLVKAQQVKNAVIVPYGAKGGFFPKQLPPASAGRDAMRDAGLAAYRLFISTLLGLVDNLKGGDIVTADQVVRHDADDPYLVVAADKGTATFSDTANEIAAEHGLWLDDAFASGGSAGYDHKKMGITSRGAWECVKRHFRELDRDVQSQPFTAVGIGDMSGDVFGNGMLRSRKTRLIAAFDHRDIFIDPDPDPETGFVERDRLFALPRSSWQDYDTDKISVGGGVFSRSAKSISLSEEATAVLGLSAGDLTPNELIRAILRAEVDLLWFGGIGTYVRASWESNDEAGDRANDAVRVTADELRAKVIGEGANLGVTQAARIAFATGGGRINTDFIDNSAGVNCSDQEVNIKIALSAAMGAGKLDRASRDRLLAEMTDDVAEACLRNNYLQSLAISLGAQRGLADLGFQQRLMRSLERTGELDRTIEVLPSDAEISERHETGQPLTRPELAVLLSYAKLDLLGELLASDVPDNPVNAPLLIDYFPDKLVALYGPEIEGHRLRREIIATELTNAIINRGGSTMVVRLIEETGRSAADIAEAFVAAQTVFNLDGLWARIDALDNAISGKAQLALYQNVQELVREKTAWFLRHRTVDEGLSQLIARHSEGLRTLQNALSEVLTQERSEAIARAQAEYREMGVPDDLAAVLAALLPLRDGPDIATVAGGSNCSIDAAAQAFFQVGDYFGLATLQARARRLSVTDTFDRLAINSAMSMISDAQRLLSESVLGSSSGGFAAWLETQGENVLRARTSMQEVAGATELTVSRLTVAAGQLRDLAESGTRVN